ncbi:MAG: hypothetical protein IJK64_11215 [Clostridia bacterium]|nr:hypothetical protein [Clostridia bacterium]
MAKYEAYLSGSFDELLQVIHNAVTTGSSSATLEGASDLGASDRRVAVRVYERYSWLGGNRVSLSVTLAQTENGVFVSAIASGGSQAIFFKINTFGEQAFLETLTSILDSYAIR